MNLIVEGAKYKGEDSYTVTIRLSGIPDAKTCEALGDALTRVIAQALVDLGAESVEAVTTH